MKYTGINSLSGVEIEIIEHIRKGCSLKEIADILHTSEKTLEIYQYSMAKKLKLRNAIALDTYINNSQLELYERYAI